MAKESEEFRRAQYIEFHDSQKRPDPPPVPNPNSQQLLELFQEGRSDAAAAIFERYVARLLALARSRIGPRLKRRVDADDVVQSAYRSFFVHAQNEEYQLSEAGDLWRLLASITLHKVHKQIEKQTAAKRSIEKEEPAATSSRNTKSPEPTAAEVIGIAEELQSVLASLTDNERHALNLHLQGYDQEDICQTLEKSSRTTRRLLASAKQKIEKRFARDESALTSATFATHATLRYSDYVLERLLGAGGMGKVFRAREKAQGTLVAIKALHKSRQRDVRAVAQFVQEANVLARLRHPHIVGIQGLGRFPGGGYFIVMDYVEGGDLLQSLKGGPLPVGEALRLAGQIAEAIGHAHEHGIVHCDLKPANVLLDTSGQASVSDFGFAFLVAGAPPYSEKAIGGTAGYIAPEVQYQGRKPTPAADIYALGILLWQMVTGTVPRDSQQLVTEREDLEPVRMIVCRCIEENPLKRYVSASELSRKINNLRL